MKKLLLLVLLCASITFLIGAAAGDPPDKTFTVEELGQYNGKDGAKAYVAIDDIVYDVTLVTAWRGGKHKMGITAGKDLSKEITRAPHGKAVLTSLPKVGTLKN